jgi:hypothetical protein
VAISLLTGILSFAAVPLSGLVGVLLAIVGAVGWAVVFTMLGPVGGP